MSKARTFQTALGNIQVKESGVVHIHILVQEVNLEVLETHYVELEKQLVAPKHAFVLTFEPSYLKMNALSRRYNNEKMNYWCTSMGVVVDQPLIRAFVNMYIRISPLKYRIKTFATQLEAERWAIDGGSVVG